MGYRRFFLFPVVGYGMAQQIQMVQGFKSGILGGFCPKYYFV